MKIPYWAEREDKIRISSLAGERRQVSQLAIFFIGKFLSLCEAKISEILMKNKVAAISNSGQNNNLLRSLMSQIVYGLLLRAYNLLQSVYKASTIVIRIRKIQGDPEK